MTLNQPAPPARPPGPTYRVDGAARDRADRNAAHVSELLTRRPDLRGVHAPADWFADAVCWSV